MGEIGNQLASFNQGWQVFKSEHGGRVEGLLEATTEELKSLREDEKANVHNVHPMVPAGNLADRFTLLKKTLHYLEDLAQMTPEKFCSKTQGANLTIAQKRLANGAENFGQRQIILAFKSIIDSFNFFAMDLERRRGVWTDEFHLPMEKISRDCLTLALDDLFAMLPKAQREKVRGYAPEAIKTLLPAENQIANLPKIKQLKNELVAFNLAQKKGFFGNKNLSLRVDVLEWIKNEFGVIPGKLASESNLEPMLQALEQHETEVEKLTKEAEGGPHQYVAQWNLGPISYTRNVLRASYEHQQQLKSLIEA